ncbi:MAG: 2-amino-4-hydroxy-6-hydroxymethyldihydropteridine diphosphokinase, partial [Candidatus Fonsibacter sp.]
NKINEPRTCDIDIIDFNKKKISFSSKDFKLEIPHPRFENRNFVLFPIKDLDSEWVSPLSGKSINQLIEELEVKSKNNITKV